MLGAWVRAWVRACLPACLSVSDCVSVYVRVSHNAIASLPAGIVARSDLSLELLEDDDAGDLIAISDAERHREAPSQQQTSPHSAGTADDPDERFGR